MALDPRVVKFEHFINDILRAHLRKLVDERNKLCEEAGEYLQLKTAIQRLQEDCTHDRKLRTQVDIGCSFFCQAEVPDASRVFVCLGMGIFTELTHPEAIEFIDKKQELLKTRIDHMSEQCAEVKARIQMALQALGDLQGLVSELPSAPHDIWS